MVVSVPQIYNNKHNIKPDAISDIVYDLVSGPNTMIIFLKYPPDIIPIRFGWCMDEVRMQHIYSIASACEVRGKCVASA
jgi:hypothetical protein